MTAGGVQFDDDLIGALQARVAKHQGTSDALYYQDAIDEILRLRLLLANGKVTDAPDKRVAGGAVPPARTNPTESDDAQSSLPPASDATPHVAETEGRP